MPARKKDLGLTLLRRSSGRQELSLPSQLGWAIKAAEGMGVVLDARLTDIELMQAQRLSEHNSICLDDSISGANLDRPGFRAMVERASTDKRISHVFIYKRDRFARPEEASGMVQLENQLRRKGITLVFNDKIAGPLDRGEIDQAGDVLALLEYLQSGEFLNVLAERVIAAQQLLARGGYWTGGSPPYGFVRVLVDAQDNILEELPPGRRVRQAGCHVRIMAKDKEKIAVWLKMLELAHSGWGAKRIAGYLNDLGIPSPNAGHVRTDHGIKHLVTGKWGHRTVLELLQNGAIVSELAYGKRSEGAHRRLGPEGPRRLTDHDLHPDGRPKLTYNANDSVIRATTGFAPEYDANEFDVVQDMLKERGRSQRGIPRVRDVSRYPLSTRVVDMTDNCGAIMYCRTSGKRRLYLCGRYSRTGGAECENNTVDAEALLKMTLATIKQWLTKPGEREKLRQQLKDIARNEASGAPESNGSNTATLLRTQQKQLEEQLEIANYRMAREQDDDRYEAICEQRNQIKIELVRIEKETEKHALRNPGRRGSDGADDVDAAIDLLDNLERVIGDENARAELPKLFRDLGLRIGVNFDSDLKGKRPVRRLLGGVLAFDGAELPVRLHGDLAVEAQPSHMVAHGSVKTTGSGIESESCVIEEHPGTFDDGCPSTAGPPNGVDVQQKGISFIKVNRGDRRLTFLNEPVVSDLFWRGIAQTLSFSADQFFSQGE